MAISLRVSYVSCHHILHTYMYNYKVAHMHHVNIYVIVRDPSGGPRSHRSCRVGRTTRSKTSGTRASRRSSGSGASTPPRTSRSTTTTSSLQTTTPWRRIVIRTTSSSPHQPTTTVSPLWTPPAATTLSRHTPRPSASTHFP